MSAYSELQAIDKKFTRLKDATGSLNDCIENEMAEVRLDIEDIGDTIQSLQKMIQEQKGQMYNYKVGLTILSVFVFISYIIR